MAENKVRIVIEVDSANGTAVIKGFGADAENSLKRISSSGATAGSALATLKAHWLEVSAAAYASYAMMQKAIEFMNEGAKASQVESSFKIMADASRVNADSMIADMKRVTRETVDDSDLMQKAVKLMTMGYDPAQIVRFSNVVVTASQISGQSVGETYEVLSDAIATKMPRALVRMGAVTREQMKIVNEAVAAGADEAALYELAMANLELKQLQLKGTQDEASISLQKFHAQMKEAGEVGGQILIIAMQKLYAVFQGFGVASLEVSSAFFSLAQARNAFAASIHFGAEKKEYEDAAAAYGKMAADDKAAAASLRAAMIDNFMGTSAASAKATDSQTADAKRLVKEKEAALKAEAGAKAAAEATSKSVVKNFEEMIRVSAEFEAEYAKATKTTEQQELQSLNVRLANYQKFGMDEVRLEEITQAGIRDAMIKANNEKIALEEELFKATKEQQYADAAIAAMKEVLDAEEAKWAKILQSDEAAHRLRIQREKEYTDKFKDQVEERVTVEKEAVAEITAIKEAESLAPAASAAASSAASSAGPGTVTYATVGGVTFINNNAGAEAYYRQLQEIAANTKRAADESAKTALAAQEEAQRAAEQAQRERQQAFDSGYGRYQGMVQERERRSWGIQDYTAEFARLGESFAKSSDFQQSLGYLDKMLDTLVSIDGYEQEALEANRKLSEDLANQGKGITDWLADLNRSDLAPVQSAEAWGVTFTEKRSAAIAGLGTENAANTTSDFLQYSQEYLQFAKAYGDAQSYLQVYNAVVGTVEDLGGTVKLLETLSGLGLGSTPGQLTAVVNAFGTLGISAEALRAAAVAANTAIGGDAGLNTSLTATKSPAESTAAAIKTLKDNAIGAAGAEGLGLLIAALASSDNTGIPGAVTTATGDKGLKKLADALGIALPNAAGGSSTSTGNLADVLQNTQTPFANVNTALAALATNTQTQLQTVGSYWDALATKMGLTMNGTTAAALIGSMQPPVSNTTTYTQPKYNSYTIAAGYWYLPGTNQQWSEAEYAAHVPRLGGGNAVYMAPGTYLDYAHPNYATGGLTRGLSNAGELGPEWIIPTYEPQRSSFLRDVGADPEAIGRSVAAQLRPLLAGLAGGIGGGNTKIELHVHLDGREIRASVVEGYRSGNDHELIEQTRRIARLG